VSMGASFAPIDPIEALALGALSSHVRAPETAAF